MSGLSPQEPPFLASYITGDCQGLLRSPEASHLSLILLVFSTTSMSIRILYFTWGGKELVRRVHVGKYHSSPEPVFLQQGQGSLSELKFIIIAFKLIPGSSTVDNHKG